MRRTNPYIVLLTDGSGSTGHSRIDLSQKLIADAGAELLIAGYFAEPELYSMMLRGETRRLTELVDELAAQIVDKNISIVVCDAVEGYHPVHDLCLPLTQAALKVAGKSTAARIAHYEYRVIGDPRADVGHREDLQLRLDEVMLSEKIESSRRYAAQSGSVLMQEVQYMFDTYGESSFRFEVFQTAGTEHPQLYDGLRYYELRGEEQVKSGRYKQVLRHALHMQPIEAALQLYVDRAMH